MDRKRRVEVYTKPALSHSNENYLQPFADMQNDQASLKKRNPCSHHTQGFYPKETNRKQHDQKTKTRNRMVYILVIIVLLAVFAYAAYQITIYIIQTSKAIEDEQMIQEIIAENELISADDSESNLKDQDIIASTAPVMASAPIETPIAIMNNFTDAHRIYTQPAEPDVLIQFSKALAINPDTVGELQIGESIHTYVVQRDNSYYLRHSFSGEYSFSGAIFLDISCSIFPQSRNLIIHGHNMQNGTALGKLLRFEKINYLDQYPIIYFSTLYESAEYLPFAVVYYSINPRSKDYMDIYQINYISDQAFAEFVQAVKSRFVYHIPVNVAKTDSILTITTCATDDPDMRFAVFAVKILSLSSR